MLFVRRALAQQSQQAGGHPAIFLDQLCSKSIPSEAFHNLGYFLQESAQAVPKEPQHFLHVLLPQSNEGLGRQPGH